MDSQVALTKHGVIGVIEINNPPVNASSSTVRQGLLHCVRAAEDDPSIQALVVICAGRTFMAGADIKEFDQAELPLPDPNEVHVAFESFRGLVVAALHGTVLGGGLELGVLPGGGGTQRLTRIVGIENALNMIVSGNPIDADNAFTLGLVDVIAENHLKEESIAFAMDLLRQQAPRKRAVDLTLDVSLASPPYFEDFRGKLTPAVRNRTAVQEIVRCIQESLVLPFDEGLRIERAAFLRCKDSSESQA
ncbi:enoyl-CoA hydratase/isomerase family protein [Glaciimonas immobilis]|uniref:Enoyl-CoA hydratase/carnithine racemase n=1 Tax=Glaciimonas immobilis TaxID=728004 RepID=A0A840RTL9_9BURK|nr:enoyl-CoA hydratase/isomerase family protein [Glaciimonas immobilis]KAF3997084.1 enoyl-CoA hydratase/isomerase family protein [Glaciimonas immobilis]MBB5199941.1 enoyl-CoA hydratase/carnithine racemase [Glaciimonas immobilis]